MSDLRELLSAEADRLRPDRVPAFDEIVARRRREQRVMRAAAAIAVIGVVTAGAVLGPRLVGRHEALPPSVIPTSAPTLPPGAVPDVLVVECDSGGPSLPNGPRVAAQADGVHYTLRNRGGDRLHVAIVGERSEIAGHGSRSATTSRLVPGRLDRFSCAADPAGLATHAVAVTVEDPQRLFVPIPDCQDTPTSVSDGRGGSFGAPMKGEPLELSRQLFGGADPVGYPQANPRLFAVTDLLVAWAPDGGASWVPTFYRCSAVSTHVVAAGIKAPAPVKLAHTDEFGLVRAVRQNGDVIEVDVDRVDMLSGAEAEAAAAAAGTEVSNDYFLRNDNPMVRTYRIWPSADVWGSITMLPNAEPWPNLSTVEVWQAFVRTERARDTLFHFQVDDGHSGFPVDKGVVIGIEEQYRP